MDIQVGDKVELLIEKKTDLGYRVFIQDVGEEALLFDSDVFQELEENTEVIGYIKNIREDGLIDVSLKPQGYLNAIDPTVNTILDALNERPTKELMLTDKSTPEDIRSQLNMSKKMFKKAIGSLYKEKRISIESDRIKLLK